MTRPRVIETDQGIQGEVTVALYDQMQRRLRDRGWIETQALLKNGITTGLALEVGPGPGYLGLEWLKKTQGTRLNGLDISPDMIALAERNAAEYGLSDRAAYVLGHGDHLPFDDGAFDAVFANGSLHEWADPTAVLGEMWRVLKTGGKIFVSDLRRDMPVPMRWFLRLVTQPKEIRPGLVSSIHAAYTTSELRSLIQPTELQSCTITSNLLGLTLAGTK